MDAPLIYLKITP